MKNNDANQGEKEEKLLSWLGTEGYPLEFFTAHAFKKHGFGVAQSHFVKDLNGKVREIDVLASKDYTVNDAVLRLIHVVECKWSKDKPWLLFKDDTRVTSSALVTQMIANDAGEAVTWMQAGDENLKDLPIFADRGFAFSGRQAFTKDADRFYQSAQSVISNSVSVAAYYTRSLQESRFFPLVVVCIPLIVLDGDMYEVSYSDENMKLQLDAKKHIRLRWKGNADYSLNSIIDVVTKPYLDEFLRSRIGEMQTISNVFLIATKQLYDVYHGNAVRELTITPGPRGILGKPNFFSDLMKHVERRKNSKK